MLLAYKWRLSNLERLDLGVGPRITIFVESKKKESRQKCENIETLILLFSDAEGGEAVLDEHSEIKHHLK